VTAENELPESTPKKIEPVYFTPAALQLMLNFEMGGGEGYYNRKFSHPIWPGGESGIMIGIGYDLGSNDLVKFTEDWKWRLQPWPYQLLRSTLGVKGEAAKLRQSLMTTITISWEDALAVFRSRTIPRFYKMTAEVYPGLERLPGDAQGALVSLIYNRGASLEGDRRQEMRRIKDAVASLDLQAIAQSLRDMKRLWEGQEMTALIGRREEEAKLVEQASSAFSC
jgi:GH24 family phage-related lysozyme (muramidase)